MKNIAIIMSTYNGERFLAEQLDSLFRQDVDNNKYRLTVYCRDDGSSDGTSEILNEYSKRKGNLVILKNSGQNMGVKLSFRSLLLNVEADYYFFCDQDDIWNDNKVSLFMKKFSEMREDIPAGVYSDLLLVDSKNNSLNKTMSTSNSWNNENRDFIFFLFKLRVTGAAFAINVLTRNCLVTIDSERFKQVRMHDSIAALIVASYNNLQYISECTVRYRQHGDNVLGAFSEKKSLTDIEYRRKSMNQFFFDLKTLKLAEKKENIPSKNSFLLNKALKFNRSNFLLSKWLLIEDCFSLWGKIGLKRFVFFMFFYK